MGKKNSRYLNRIYQKPLPIVLASEKYGIDLRVNRQSVSVFSWILYLFKFFKCYLLSLRDTCCQEDLVEVLVEDGVFKVVNEAFMTRLWRSGFFGKGILSRSEPTWKERTISRLNLEDSTFQKRNLAMEDITKVRRTERIEFKKKRQRLQDLQLKEKQNTIEEAELEEMKRLDESLVEFRKRVGIVVGEEEKEKEKDEEPLDADVRKEDKFVIDTQGKLVQLEFLQLQAVEVFFLKFALNIVSVVDDIKAMSLQELFQYCCRLYAGNNKICANNKFIINYIVYHYFRSKGWCVRSGVKFGTDYLLYKRGPPFSHAEFCIQILEDEKSMGDESVGDESVGDFEGRMSCERSVGMVDWFQMSAGARVVGGVKKSFVHIYVEPPSQFEFDEIISNGNDGVDDGLVIKKLFGRYRVSEILYKRWNPSRSRD
ncbi:SEN2 [Candida oxycetoniae]|uniref:tRNA-splicing endonuclease subunit Sen2 n=1 Tax=Candida oxycetoniae TaxID=497107 RepID=A0AAI9SXM6_9ASCO|nr:SEN2 [Candida oxycetoniae]KAI3404628.2 SEN2 [Candida oxycetoniae]